MTLSKHWQRVHAPKPKKMTRVFSGKNVKFTINGEEIQLGDVEAMVHDEVILKNKHDFKTKRIGKVNIKHVSISTSPTDENTHWTALEYVLKKGK